MPHHPPNTAVCISYKQEQPPTDPQYNYHRKLTDTTLPFNLQTPTVPLMSFIGIVHSHVLHLVIPSLVFFSLEQCFSLSLTFMALTHLKITGQLFYRMSPNVWCFLMIKFSWCMLGSNIMKQCCDLLIAFYQRCRILIYSFTEKVSLNHLIKVMSANFSTVNVLFSF